jgi:hypothetical protein
MRQLASRARRRVRGATPAVDPDLREQRRVVDAFLAASRAGDFAALLEVLDPDVVFRLDAGGIAPRARPPLEGRGGRGAGARARQSIRRLRASRNRERHGRRDRRAGQEANRRRRLHRHRRSDRRNRRDCGSSQAPRTCVTSPRPRRVVRYPSGGNPALSSRLRADLRCIGAWCACPNQSRSGTSP